MNKQFPRIVLLTLLLAACNLPASNPATFSPASTSPTAIPAVPGGPVLILSPQAGAELSGGPLAIQFTATDGPFIEADLLVDNTPVTSAVQDGTSSSISGTLVWDQPVPGAHTLTVMALTLNKEVLSASVQVTVAGSGGAGQGGSVDPTPPAQSTVDTGLETARQRVIQILHDTYGVNMTDPAVGRKSREGVTTDPWTAALYYKDWFINISIYPDGREVDYAYPLNYSNPAPLSAFMKPGGKLIPMCRPSGLIKMLVVFVDYQNLGVTQKEALDSLTESVNQINRRYVEASQAVGLQSPILQLQATGAYLSSPPAALDQLLTPALVQTTTSVDPAGFDLLIQIDLDASDTVHIISEYGSYGFATSGCGTLPSDVNMWIGISKKEQLDLNSGDPRLSYTLGHEILHTLGYPIGLTGAHEWVCGDGSIPDRTDQCDQNNLPTLMLGWTDTDGDGVVEILDTTPYGLQTP